MHLSSASQHESRRNSISNESFDNLNIEESVSSEQNKGCIVCLHNTLIKICERWFISLGVVAILFIVIGFFRFTNDKHGETLVFTGVGFLVILSTFMASQRHRAQRQREAAGQVLRSATEPIYVVTFPSDTLSDPNQSPLFPSLVLPSDESRFPVQWQNLTTPKPKRDDPPPYDDVTAPPPTYESLQFTSRPS